jgi:TrmH family RNA methyltransferase
MLTKSQIKLYKSLEHKKFRTESNLFVAEGTKTVREFINNDWQIETIITTEDWLKKNPHIKKHKNLVITNYNEIQKLSFQDDSHFS